MILGWSVRSFGLLFCGSVMSQDSALLLLLLLLLPLNYPASRWASIRSSAPVPLASHPRRVVRVDIKHVPRLVLTPAQLLLFIFKRVSYGKCIILLLNVALSFSLRPHEPPRCDPDRRL